LPARRISPRCRDKFVAKVGRRLPHPVAAALHDAAVAQERIMANVVAAARTDAAAATTVQTIDQAIDASCGCEECRSAAGPAAYLADLLDYAVRHLRRVVAGRGLRGEYFTGAFTQKQLERLDATIDFDWGAGAPDPRLPADGFSVRWTGTLRPRYSEAYQFTVQSDDGVKGVRLWLDGTLVVSQASWSDQAGTELRCWISGSWQPSRLSKCCRRRWRSRQCCHESRGRQRGLNTRNRQCESLGGWHT
jgi:PA14 domain